MGLGIIGTDGAGGAGFDPGFGPGAGFGCDAPCSSCGAAEVGAVGGGVDTDVAVTVVRLVPVVGVGDESSEHPAANTPASATATTSFFIGTLPFRRPVARQPSN
ncbi:hypothetical protein [Nocardia farcinica]|uniref:hypothetical protein n=1 Tax=Nocardia farcinica TaxID=37329 RepID=UPI000761367B|nr:hypothetical protein [Nocardia farcinica]AXK85226.1 hypothetical protein DXT66_05890 [Nocardia farcinica]MBF6067926.1 hypothetical protein [Nocardia farcinica]MBF6294469.1 hypothetical protein [Nocardia farcinica]MBF6375339.1 hypothetical protein [Nocardia farcinica]MBF6381307.1 hypothetical protein [Nocardia farcinica]